MGFLSAAPYNPPTITVEAARRAAAGSGKRKIPSGVINNLAKKSRRIATEFQHDMEKHVKRKLDSMSGSQDNRKLGLKVAQFIPGKGLEVEGAQVENDPSIYCSLGLKGDKHVDPLDETFARIKGRQVSMDFAFKLVNDTSSLLDHDKDTRVTTMNCFRHVNPDSFNYDITGWHKDVSVPGYVSNINVVYGGVYSDKVAVCTITGNATCDLNWQATAGGFKVWSITVLNQGSGYTSAPTVSITGGTVVPGDFPATATAEVSTLGVVKSDANFNWHSTLGPDASLIRVGTNGYSSGSHDYAGTFRGQTFVKGTGVLDQTAAPTGHLTAQGNTLLSPYRYPKDMEIMYSRVNRQLLENYGWLLNPFKFVNPSSNSTVDSPDPERDSLKVWSNPGSSVLDFTDTSQSNTRSNSYPAKINIQPDVEEAAQISASGYEWHSQFGPGKLSYQFSNDGTNPVCIDICVVGVKKDNPSAIVNLQHICDYNYAVHKYANNNTTDLNGFQASTTTQGDIDFALGKHEWHKNAKLPFMPNECFKNPQSLLGALDFNPGSGGGPNTAQEVFSYLEQGKKNPFKVVKRDQFIVSSGSSRSWNTTLPSIKYRPQVYDDVEYPLVPQNAWLESEKVVTTADEYTFVLCIGASGMPKPVEEIYSSNQPTSIDNDGNVVKSLVDAKAIIDRQPSTCNVSVVGTYKETVYPCYPQDRTSVNFINGRLTEPYFTNPPGLLVPSTNTALQSRVNTVDIAQLGQVVHVSADGIVGVGAITTEIGA